MSASPLVGGGKSELVEEYVCADDNEGWKLWSARGRLNYTREVTPNRSRHKGKHVLLKKSSSIQSVFRPPVLVRPLVATARWAASFDVLLRCKSNAPRRIVIHPQNLTAMTYVMNSSFSIFANQPVNRDILKEYWVEVVLFDGGTETVSIYAYNEDDAQQQAASMFDDVDYTMVQGCYEY